MPHIHELYDFTVSVFIVHNGRVLFVNHPRYGKWLPPGGHIELDEDPEQALYREIQEETGLTVCILSSKPHLESVGTKFMPTPNYLDVHEANAPHKHVGLTYFAVSDDDKAVLSNEHSEIAWLDATAWSEERYNLSPAIRFYAEQAALLAAQD